MYIDQGFDIENVSRHPYLQQLVTSHKQWTVYDTMIRKGAWNHRTHFYVI